MVPVWVASAGRSNDSQLHVRARSASSVVGAGNGLMAVAGTVEKWLPGLGLHLEAGTRMTQWPNQSMVGWMQRYCQLESG